MSRPQCTWVTFHTAEHIEAFVTELTVCHNLMYVIFRAHCRDLWCGCIPEHRDKCMIHNASLWMVKLGIQTQISMHSFHNTQYLTQYNVHVYALQLECRTMLCSDIHSPHLSFSRRTERTETRTPSFFFFFPAEQVWVEIPLCTASVTDRKAHSCILIWSFAEHMERMEKAIFFIAETNGPLCCYLVYNQRERESARCMPAFSLYQGPPECINISSRV